MSESRGGGANEQLGGANKRAKHAQVGEENF